ncbi:hypothetical protein CAEBREN_07095 [Caenorhabditis brenneri]|uniref:3'-5' exonuclease domain-containing protein n=1 Tax=Caenorhabditis brenneri TaxID=135651 RepID=G0MXB1_CAEBE|nr:hypothetical protein CAEBREN_07095 [Caenorhabditis brenneri]
MAYLHSRPNRTRMLHREIASSMQRRISKDQPISQSAALGLIQMGDRAGQYRGKHLDQLLDIVKKLRHQGAIDGTKENIKYRMTEDVYHACCGILLNRSCETSWQRELQQYGPDALSPTLNYSIFNDGTFEIIEEWEGERAERILENFFWKPSKTAVYIDTEGSLIDLPRDTFKRLALITLCDPRARKILLWRVDDYTDHNITLVREALDQLSAKRDLVVFGHEELLTPKTGFKIPCKDLQKPFSSGGDMISLKKLAKKFDFTIEKAETISDWTRRYLTEDQKQYASMDAYILYEIDISPKWNAVQEELAKDRENKKNLAGKFSTMQV